MKSTISILITDTNIWIDLNHGGILQEFFRLPYRIAAPDFVISRELHRPSWKTLVSLGLELIELGPNLVAELFELNQNQRSISFTDLATLILAKDLQGILLTGDHHLRGLAQEYKVQVHGILWALDKLIEFNVLSDITAHEALDQMLIKGSYLPREDVTKRIKRWRSS